MLVSLGSKNVLIQFKAIGKRQAPPVMSQPQTIRAIIENLDEQRRLCEVLLAGGRGLPEHVFKKLLSTIVSANDHAQILLDTMIRHDAERAVGKIAARRKAN